MNSKEIIDYLKSEASEKYKENVIKMGIPEKFCIGVSTSTLRKFAKKLDKSNELAFELWNTHYHEARLLAVLIFDHKCLSYDQIDTLMSEVLSWDLCDHLCKNLIIKLDYYEDFIFNWIAADHIYKKRASFVLIAASTIHDKSMTKETLDIYLKLVYENSCYEHDHIKKAVSWALREIGKTDFEYAEKVLLTAYDLLASGTKVQIWIAKDVIKELETVVKVKERKRLITSNSKMGRVLWSSFFVTLVAKKIVLINLCCRPCFIWGSITIITVWTNMIIINVCKFFYLLIECFLCCKLIQICAFILQGIEITLHRCIVVRISCFAHALCHIYRFAEFGKCFGRIL